MIFVPEYAACGSVEPDVGVPHAHGESSGPPEPDAVPLQPAWNGSTLSKSVQYSVTVFA